MDRRLFLKTLVVGVAGLYVPKTLYFDMKPRIILPEEPILILHKLVGRYLDQHRVKFTEELIGSRLPEMRQEFEKIHGVLYTPPL